MDITVLIGHIIAYATLLATLIVLIIFIAKGKFISAAVTITVAGLLVFCVGFFFPAKFGLLPGESQSVFENLNASMGKNIWDLHNILKEQAALDANLVDLFNLCTTAIVGFWIIMSSIIFYVIGGIIIAIALNLNRKEIHAKKERSVLDIASNSGWN